MNKIKLIFGVVMLFVIGLATAQLYPQFFAVENKIYDICPYMPNFDLAYEILNTTSINSSHDFIDVQGFIYTYNKSCIKGYVFNATIPNTWDKDTYIITQLGEELERASHDITFPSNVSNPSGGTTLGGDGFGI